MCLVLDSDGVQREAELFWDSSKLDHVPHQGTSPGPQNCSQELQLLVRRHHHDALTRRLSSRRLPRPLLHRRRLLPCLYYGIMTYYIISSPNLLHNFNLHNTGLASLDNVKSGPGAPAGAGVLWWTPEGPRSRFLRCNVLDLDRHGRA